MLYAWLWPRPGIGLWQGQTAADDRMPGLDDDRAGSGGQPLSPTNGLVLIGRLDLPARSHEPRVPAVG